jgi:hypothetical protein
LGFIILLQENIYKNMWMSLHLDTTQDK